MAGAGRVGLTTTVPVEVLYAAGCQPVDLNNLFISGPDPAGRVEVAERAGYPRNVCGWIKGLYATALAESDLQEIVAVTQGDCSNTHALLETLQVAGLKIVPFAFPFDRDGDLLRLQIEKLMNHFGVGWPEVEQAKQRLDEVRRLAWEVDRRTWQENTVSGWENHLFQVSCSDLEGNPEDFGAKLRAFLAERREPLPEGVRLGYLGVPPINPDLYDFLESLGARVVYNEIQRQFSLPFPGMGLVESYQFYTYPYDVFGRLEDIKREAARRRLDGLIHYTQSFCFRQIEDLILRRELRLPLLTLEGDRPGGLDARSKVRLEAFVEMLSLSL